MLENRSHPCAKCGGHVFGWDGKEYETRPMRQEEKTIPEDHTFDLLVDGVVVRQPKDFRLRIEYVATYPQHRCKNNPSMRPTCKKCGEPMSVAAEKPNGWICPECLE